MFFFNDTATTEIYTLSLHDALPIFVLGPRLDRETRGPEHRLGAGAVGRPPIGPVVRVLALEDRKSTRLNSSHANISYAVFCLKKKNFYFSLLTYLNPLSILTSLLVP